MSQEIKDLHFQHTLASGKTLRLSVFRKADTKPRMEADSVAGLTAVELEEYRRWKFQIVTSMMASLTVEEVVACAEHGLRARKQAGRVTGAL